MMKIDNHNVHVGENLYKALCHVRSSKEERILWADAICINQFDLEERNCQVALMAFIYSRAQMLLYGLVIMPTSLQALTQLATGPTQ
jgi:hypothetical protein